MEAAKHRAKRGRRRGAPAEPPPAAGMDAGEFFKRLREKAVVEAGEEWAKSGYAAVAVAASSGAKYVVVHDRRAGEVQVLLARGGLICHGYSGRGPLDCDVDFNEAEVLNRRVKKYIYSPSDAVEVVAL